MYFCFLKEMLNTGGRYYSDSLKGLIYFVYCW